MQLGVEEEIIDAIVKLGNRGATITEIEQHVSFERHTLSKYLSIMGREGLLTFKPVGKAKVWFINNAPLQTVVNAPPENTTFTEKILLDLIAKTPMGIILIDKDYNIQFMNGLMRDAYGDATNEKFYERILGMEHPLKIKKIGRVIENKSATAELEVVDTHNNILAVKASRMINPDDTLSVILIIDNITERKQAETALKKSEQRFRNIFDYSNDGIFVIEPASDRIIEVNPKACKMLGYTREELLDLPISSVHPDEMPQLMKFADSVTKNGHAWTNRLCCVTKRKQCLKSEISASVYEMDGKNYIIAMVREVGQLQKFK